MMSFAEALERHDNNQKRQSINNMNKKTTLFNESDYRVLNIAYKTEYGTEEYKEFLADEYDFANTVGTYIGDDSKKYIIELIKAKEQLLMLLDTLKYGLNDINDYYSDFMEELKYYIDYSSKESDLNERYLKLEDGISHEADNLNKQVKRKIDFLFKTINSATKNN